MITLSTSTSHDVSVPNSAVVVPMRPYTQAVGAAARSRARRRIVSASMPVAWATTSGVNGAARRDDLVEPGDEVGAGAQVDEALAGDDLHHRHQQVGVGAGPDGHPLRGHLRGARPARVDDHERAAALHEALEAAGPVGRGGQRAVGGERVGAEHEEVVGAVDVGHRHVQAAAEHERRRDLLRTLVDRRRREEVGGAEGPEQRPVVEQAGQVVGVGVADVHRARRRGRAPRAPAAGVARSRRRPRPR